VGGGPAGEGMQVGIVMSGLNRIQGL
jgi:hypothetical protein